MKNILITGAAGFIGFHLSKELVLEGYSVIGIDNFSDYYDTNLKKSRIELIEKLTKENSLDFTIINGDIKDKNLIKNLFSKYRPEIVINLAAQAGVRYSIENPDEYVETNFTGFFNIIDNAKEFNTKNFIYASSSSVYGGNTSKLFKETENVDHPLNLYAVTKRSNELLAHSYSHLYGLPTTGLRFFTVYGPWGRPDMAIYLFTKAIINNSEIEIFNNGNMSRSFTYIDDIVEGVKSILEDIPCHNKKYDRAQIDPSSSWAPFRILNIGNSKSYVLSDLINLIEQNLGKKAKKKYLKMHKGDVPNTKADTHLLEEIIGPKSFVSIETGIKKFIDWYKEYYGY